MPYVEFPPRPDLAHLVKCVWNYEASAEETAGRPERIVPDGNPEFVVHYGAPFSEITPERGKEPQPHAFLMGQMTRPLTLDPSQGTPGIVGVRFHPAGMRAMIGAAMDDFTDHHLKVEDLAPRATTLLIERMATSLNSAGRAAIIQDFVADFAARHARFQDQAVQQWTARLTHAKGALSVATLAQEAGLSTRQLERRFLSQVGISPRQYANVVRFRSVFDLLTPCKRPAWAALAAGAGYFDQSHMIRDFQRFLGCSPSAFLSQLRGLSAVLVGLEAETPCRVVTRRMPAAQPFTLPAGGNS
jgi:AraC-like DNA-binding protein